MNHYLIYYNTLFSYNRLCLCCLNNKIIAGFDSGKLAGMILLDFHQMLLKQLYAFRFSNNIIPGLSHTRQKKNTQISIGYYLFSSARGSNPPVLWRLSILPTPFFKFCPFWYAILLNDNMDIQQPSLGTLVTEGPWCMFYVTRC